MRKSQFKGKFAALVIMVVGLSVGCSDDYADLTKPPKAQETAYATYDIDWAEAADSSSQAFIKRFFDASQSSKGVFSYSEYNIRGGNGNCYWQQAHAMNAMIEYYNRIKTTNSDEEIRIKGFFKAWYAKHGNNYEGNLEWRGSTGFGNVFTDDTCWITITLLKIFEATGDDTYFKAAKTTWDECIWPRHKLNQFGWLPWKMNDLGANECTNGPGSIIAAMLAQYAKDSGDEAASQEYIRQAYICFDQQLSVMAGDGTLGGTPLSYTQGTCMESGRLIWKVTGDRGYLRRAILAARGQMTSTRMNEIYKGKRVMRDEGADENNSIFHAVLFNWATRMIMDTDIDAFDSKIRMELYDFVLRHASYYWSTGIVKSAEHWEDSYFSVKCYEPREVGTGGSLGAFSSAAQAIESMYMIKDVKF